jgi:excisionase family DNA binding protein
MADNADIIGRLEEIRNATLLGSKDIYTTAEACMFLGVKRSYLYELVRNRKIPYFKSRGGKLTYFKRKDLEEWMTDSNVPMIDNDK